MANVERNEQVGRVGRISASKLRFASADEAPRKSTEIWSGYVVPGGSQQSF